MATFTADLIYLGKITQSQEFEAENLKEAKNEAAEFTSNMKDQSWAVKSGLWTDVKEK